MEALESNVTARNKRARAAYTETYDIQYQAAPHHQVAAPHHQVAAPGEDAVNDEGEVSDMELNRLADNLIRMENSQIASTVEIESE